MDEVDTRKQSWITYEMRIDQIIKKTKTNFAQGDFIEFKKRAGCACPKLVEIIIHLQQRKLVMVIGMSGVHRFGL